MSSDGEQELPSCHILPYQFEPLDHRENEVAQDSTPCEITKRIGNTDWCLCGHCKPMTSEAESVCCIEEISDTFFNTRCISLSDNFGAVCLHAEVLKVALGGLNNLRGDRMDVSNRSMRRYAGYQMFTW